MFIFKANKRLRRDVKLICQIYNLSSLIYKEENLKINVVLIIVMDLTVMEIGLVVTPET